MRGFFKGLGWLSLVLGVAGGLLYAFVFDVWTMPADDPQLNASVAPSMAGGDVLLLSRNTLPNTPALVRCADPDAPGRWVVGRIIGEGGDDVVIEKDVAVAGGRRSPSARRCKPAVVDMKHPVSGEDLHLECFEEEYGGTTFGALRRFDHPNPVTKAHVENGKVYLVSDNRHVHMDSRDYGAVDRATCQRLVFRLWSAEGFGDGDHRFTLLF